MKKSLLLAVLAFSSLCATAQTSPRPPTAEEEAAAARSIQRFQATVGKKSQQELDAEAANAARFKAQHSAPSAAEVKRMRELANEGAQRGRNSAATVDSNGNIVASDPQTSTDGTPNTAASVTKAPATSDSLKDQGRYLQGVMGIDGVETMAQPARGQGAGAKASVSGAVDLACNMQAGQVRSAKGVQIRYDGCAGPAGAVQMSVAVCVAPMFRPETCGETSFTKLRLNEGAYTNGPENVRFGLGCNTSRVCTVSFSASLTIAGTGAEIQKQADEAQAKAMTNDNSMTKGLAGVYGSAEFSKQATELQSVDIIKVIDGAAQKGTGCTNSGACLSKVVTETKFTKTCDRSFLLTERAERTTLDAGKTKVCEQVRGSAHFYLDENYIISDECMERVGGEFGDGGWQWTGEIINHREGMVEVGKKLKSSCWYWWHDSGCTGDTYDVYYADISQYNRTQVGYNPLPLSTDNPVCDERPEAKTNLCQDPANWFGRTLTDSECTVTVDVDGQLASTPLDYSQKQGCGICTDKTTLTTCYGQPTSEQPEDSCGGVNLQGCEAPTVKALTFSDDNAGLVTSQRETYSCVRKTEVCAEFEGKTEDGQACSLANPDVKAMTFGIEDVRKQPTDGGGFAQAAADVALADEMVTSIQDASSDQTQLLPKLFGGKELRCEFPTSSLLGAGGLLTKQCCRTDLERPKKGFLIQHGCNHEEVELASARRQNYTHFVGEYCDKKAFFGKCLVKKQTHCAYNGMLPRLIAEQGREQLAMLVSSGGVANTATGKLTFDFYSSADTGSWAPIVTVNGVKLSAYQWPRFCADPAEVAKRQTSDPNTPDCPGMLNVWVAGCDAADCGELPSSPELGSMGWAVTNVDPLSKLTAPTSKYSVITGACNTATSQCDYTVSAWPAGQGGKVVLTKDVSFPIWDSAPQVSNGGGGFGISTSTTIMGQQQNVSDVFYRPYSYTGAPGALPATVRVDFSTDGGTKVWTTVDVPTTITGEITVPGTDLKISGSCDATINACRYRLVGTATVEAKGWGSARNPDCTGFTAGQVSAMDFGKMDLSEWLNDVMERNGTNGGDLAARVAEAAKRQVAGADPAGGGQITAPSASPAPYALATPPEGYGPFTVTLAAGGWWPYSPQAGATNSEKVTSVMVNWGDCSAPQALPVVTAINGQAAHGFRGTHGYKSPNDGSYASCGVAKEANVDHKVELTVKTEKGNTYKTSLSVRNVWSNYERSRDNVATPPPGP